MEAASVTGTEAGAAAAVDLRRITSSVTVSALGTWSYNVGLAVYAYQQTHSTTWVAIATVGRYVPALLLTWFASGWVDRFPRRSVAVAADGVCAATMIVLTLVAAAQVGLVLAIALASISSGVARVQSSAALALAADVAVESQLVRTTVRISTAEAVAVAVGPAIASAVLAVSTPAVLFALNGLTFLVSAVLIAGVRPVRRQATSTAPVSGETRLHQETLARVWPLLATRSITAFVYGADVVLLAVVATQQLRQGTNGYGWLLAAAGVGGLVAAAALHRGSGMRRTGITSSVGQALYALPLVLFVLGPQLPGSLAVQAVRGLGCVLVTSTVVVALQRSVPSATAGRVFGLGNALVLAGTCTGALAAPLLLHVGGLRPTLLVVALAPCAAQLALLPAMLRYDRTGAAELAALDPRVDVLRRLSIFREASRSSLYGLADDAEELTVGPGVELVREGADSDALYVLLSGSVDVTTKGQGATVLLRTMTAPSYFGEIGLLHGVARTATVTSIGPCELWRIAGDAFLSTAAHSGLSSALTEDMSMRLSPGQPR